MYNTKVNEPFETLNYPLSRVATFDVGKIGNRKHLVTGLLEVDVTGLKSMIKSQLRGGCEAGFISWIVKLIAESVAESPSVQAINTGKNRQIVFNDVDISMPLEREVDGKKVPLAALIRSADKKSAEEIHKEIAAFRIREISSEKDFVLTEGSGKISNRLFFNLPQWVRMIAWRVLLGNPFVRKRSMGTVIVTNTGMVGAASGWIIPRTIHNLAIGIGSVNKRPWVVGKEIQIRDILHLTVIFDHDAIDGAPAARFTAKLIKKIESIKGV